MERRVGTLNAKKIQEKKIHKKKHTRWSVGLALKTRKNTGKKKILKKIHTLGEASGGALNAKKIQVLNNLTCSTVLKYLQVQRTCVFEMDL